MPGSAAGCQQSQPEDTWSCSVPTWCDVIFCGNSLAVRETHPKTSGLPRNTDNTTYLPLETEATAGERADAVQGLRGGSAAAGAGSPSGTLAAGSTPISVDGQRPPALSGPQGTVSGAGTRILYISVSGVPRGYCWGWGGVCNLGCRFREAGTLRVCFTSDEGAEAREATRGVVASPARLLSSLWTGHGGKRDR